ncbi:glycosyl transferase [Photobacterium profundum]|uniref:glycosyl transferase n=1 Tax=Photobacterium profundum TaxID=74109 RepID=UPI003D0EBD7A
MSNSYGSMERTIAKMLARAPFLKSLAKSFYSRLVYLKARKSYRFKSDLPLEAVSSLDGLESFFGYYDKSPVSEDGLVIVHLTDSPTNTLPEMQDNIEVAVIDKKTHKVLLKLDSKTYNWQQGTRAHWLTNDLFIFNDVDKLGKRYISRVFSVNKQKEVMTFDHPVQDSFDSDFFLSINYRRLMAMRPDYGYRNLPKLNQQEVESTNDDGVWRVDFVSGESRLLLSIDDVKLVDKNKEFDGALHKLNHITISPTGKQFIFLHRYFVGKRRIDRLMLAGTDGSTIKTLANFGMVSHCFWADESTVLGYLRGPNGKDTYWLIDVDSGEFTHYANGALDQYGDGHPHVVGDWFITDTYPDKARMQYLLLCNWKTGEVKQIGEFFHGFNFNGETRCDLHPRLSKDGKTVFFDSVFSGKRQLYSMELSE